MAKRKFASLWTKAFTRSLNSITRSTVKAGSRAVDRAIKPAVEMRLPPPGAGDWIHGVAVGGAGARHFRLYRPPRVIYGELLPLIVMLHGCGQTAKSFAVSTRMNGVAAREHFFVLYPEQDRLANAQGCWNWFDTSSGRAYGEAALIMKAIDQVCLLYPVDRQRIAVAGLSAGASMAALLAARHPERFRAVVMHSGIPPGTAHSSLTALGAMHGRRTAKPLPVASSPSRSLTWPALMVIHGGRDHTVAPSNGEAAVRIWAEAAGARECASRRVQRGKRYAMTLTDFKRGRMTVATLAHVGPLGHAWSGGAENQPFSDQQGPDASRMIWAFAARQFRV